MFKKLPKITYLQALKSIAFYGSINAASRMLNVPQPTLSRTIRELEEFVDMPLIIRGRQGITLTEAGLKFATTASSIIAQLESVTREIYSLRKGGKNKLSFGVSPISINSIMNGALNQLFEKIPHLEINIEDNPLEINVARVRNGTLDFAIGNVGADVSLTDFTVEPLMECPFAVVCRKGHPLENSTHIEQLQNAKWWVTGEFKVCMRERSDFNFLSLPQTLHTRSHIVGLPLIFDSSFLALLSSVQIKKYRNLLSIIPIKNLNVVGRYSLIYKKDIPLSSLCVDIIKYLHQEAETYPWHDFG